jgi:hypothetical protein
MHGVGGGTTWATSEMVIWQKLIFFGEEGELIWLGWP